MKWTDTSEIARALYERHPDVRPLDIRFTDLHRWVCELPQFKDDPGRVNEKILEAIQSSWIDEAED